LSSRVAKALSSSNLPGSITRATLILRARIR
jgi:hypothetical protein